MMVEQLLIQSCRAAAKLVVKEWKVAVGALGAALVLGFEWLLIRFQMKDWRTWL